MVCKNSSLYSLRSALEELIYLSLVYNREQGSTVAAPEVVRAGLKQRKVGTNCRLPEKARDINQEEN